jgi:N-acetylneuraminate synthase
MIERDIARFIVLDQEPLAFALTKIGANKSGFVLVTTEHGRLVGMLTDGDVRRWLATGTTADLTTPVGTVANRHCTTAAVGTPPAELARLFSDRIRAVPLLDRSGRPAAIAFRAREAFAVGRRPIGRGHPAYVIAEIGNNHNGDPALARRLVDHAAEAGADCVKFQMRDLRHHYETADGPAQDLSAEYARDLLLKFNLAPEELFRLFDYCAARGIEPLCTPWDEPSLEALVRWGMPALKIASADLNNHDLLSLAASTGKPLICSTGMSTESEIRSSVALLRERGASFRLLHCNSTYPTPFRDVNLKYMERLAEIAGAPVGYSGHERGWVVAAAAVALGACIVEKHLTVSRDLEGNDHRVSLLPDEFRAMVDAVRTVEESLGEVAPRTLSSGERLNREALAKSLYARRDIPAGARITDDMIGARTPGHGLQPNRRKELVGREARRDIRAGTPLYASDLEDSAAKARHYRFGRRWGIPSRWHDYKSLLAQSNPSLIEYHLSYADLDADLGAWFDRALDLDLVVHAPELFRGDHILDLASPDAEYRRHSIAELQRVIDLACRLAQWHRGAPRIVVNAGGFSRARALPPGERPRLYARMRESLGALHLRGAELLPQTMPPFPWHFGGQAFHNVFIDPAEIAAFCGESGFRICLDTSHAQLACAHFGWSLGDYCRTVGRHVSHLHLADALGVDGEGLQIGEGEIDFAALAAVLDRECPGASFVPEVWQGHQDGGAGFWQALDRLERWFGGKTRPPAAAASGAAAASAPAGRH